LEYLKEQSSREIVSTRVHEGIRKFLCQKLQSSHEGERHYFSHVVKLAKDISKKIQGGEDLLVGSFVTLIYVKVVQGLTL
jgi:hypothetical protein